MAKCDLSLSLTKLDSMHLLEKDQMNINANFQRALNRLRKAQQTLTVNTPSCI